MFSKIVISGDILRPFHIGKSVESATWKNIRWLQAILTPVLRQNDIKISTLSWDEKLFLPEEQYFDTPSLYEDLSLPLNVDSWAKLSVQKNAPEALITKLHDYFHDALVVGYEMPDVLLAALYQLNTPFIDIVLHPIRFLPDLVFSFRSNVPEFYDVFEKCRLSENAIASQAGMILAKSAWMPKISDIPPGSVIVLDQVCIDRALIQKNGTFTSLYNHLDYLHQLCSEHPRVFFKPHPYNTDRKSISEIIQKLPVIIETNINFYYLLSQPEIEGTVALNSSGLFESRAFGKWGENLIPHLYDYYSTQLPVDGNVGYLVPQNSMWLTNKFWQSLLNGVEVEFNNKNEFSDFFRSNILRRTMNADWGYGFIENIVV